MNNTTNRRYHYLRFRDTTSYRRFVPVEEKLQNQQAGTASSFFTYHGTYKHLLFRKEWIAKRQEILSRDQHRCRVCGSSESLQVHHRQYHFIVRKNQFKLPWEYEDHLLVTLCQQCNQKGHNQYKVPTIQI